MESGFNKLLVKEIIGQLIHSAETIQKRSRSIKSPDDYLRNDRNLEKLDAACMQLIAIGESIKNLDKVTSGKLLKKYPEFEWKKAMAMRDILSHHYFDINSEIVCQVCKEEIPVLKKILARILEENF